MQKLNQAIVYATEKHAEQFRKGSDTPYIVHPLEVMTILQSMDAEEHVMIAGLLHDVVEDTDTSLEEIREIYGNIVAELVGKHSEDKTKTWEQRKEDDIRATLNGSRELKMLVMADKLSNLRALYRDVKKLREEVWQRFNAPKEKQAWYYSKMIDALEELQYDNDTAARYWEMVDLFKDIFNTYFYESETDTIYQICVSGEDYYLTSNCPEWQRFKGELPEGLERIYRKCAERLEDNWYDHFSFVVSQDVMDAQYPMYSSPISAQFISLCEKKLTFQGEVWGEDCEKIWGKDTYEFYYQLTEEQTYQFFYELRKEHGLECPLEQVLVRKFGNADGSLQFAEMCKRQNLKYRFLSI